MFKPQWTDSWCLWKYIQWTATSPQWEAEKWELRGLRNSWLGWYYLTFAALKITELSWTQKHLIVHLFIYLDNRWHYTGKLYWCARENTQLCYEGKLKLAAFSSKDEWLHSMLESMRRVTMHSYQMVQWTWSTAYKKLLWYHGCVWVQGTFLSTCLENDLRLS